MGEGTRTEYRVGAGTKDIHCECCGNAGKLVEVYDLVTEDGENRRENERLAIPKNKERLEPVPVCQVCRKSIFDLEGYRCYYCKSWLCPDDAKMHFAEHDMHFPHQKIPEPMCDVCQEVALTDKNSEICNECVRTMCDKCAHDHEDLGLICSECYTDAE